jgi:mevalonate kinase
MLVKASAPGSLMLLGEYAVLQGKQALVCAINKRITVTLAERPDKKIHIASQLGHLEVELSKLIITQPFLFITAVIKKFSKQLPTGFDLRIESEFSEQVGLGSSAAVTVAVIKAITVWLNLAYTDEQLIHAARAIIRQVQGLGSGADTAACVLGGIVAYKSSPLQAEKISHQPPITAVYSGYKTPTADAVKQVKNYFSAYPRIFKHLCQAIDSCTTQGIQSVREQDWPTFGKMLDTQQGLMDSLGVNTPELREIITTLRADHQILGAKISGSGLGDCAIGLGVSKALQFSNEKIQVVPLSISLEGVRCEKI